MAKVDQMRIFKNQLKLFEPKQPSPLSQLMVYFFNFLSYLLLLPFSINYDKVGGYYVKSTSPFHQILFLVTCIVVNGQYLWYIFLSPEMSSTEMDMQTKLGVGMVIAWLLCISNTMICMWRIKKSGSLSKILKVVDEIHQNLEHFEAKRFTLTWVRVILGLLLTAFVLFSLFDYSIDIGAFKNGYSLQGFSKTVFSLLNNTIPSLDAYNWGPAHPMLNRSEHIPETIESIGIFPPAYFIVTIVYVYQNIMAQLFTHMGDFICLTNALVLYVLVSSFVDYLSSEKSTNCHWSLVMKVFDLFCDLSEAMNDTFGSIAAWSVFGLLPFYTSRLAGFFAQNFFKSLKIALYVVNFLLTHILAAEANSKISYLALWLQRNQGKRKSSNQNINERFDSQERLALVLSQIQSNQVGIKGKFYTITHGFVGNMVSLILTYTIIIYQFQSTT